MKIKVENTYLKGSIVAVASGIGLWIATKARGLHVFQSLQDFVSWILILAIFVVFMLIVKLVFHDIRIRDVMDGVWVGLVLAILVETPIWLFKQNILAGIIVNLGYFVFAGCVWFFGNYLRIKGEKMY